MIGALLFKGDLSWDIIVFGAVRRFLLYRAILGIHIKEYDPLKYVLIVEDQRCIMMGMCLQLVQN
jgi:hypothetical protein